MEVELGLVKKGPLSFNDMNSMDEGESYFIAELCCQLIGPPNRQLRGAEWYQRNRVGQVHRVERFAFSEIQHAFRHCLGNKAFDQPAQGIQILDIAVSLQYPYS